MKNNSWQRVAQAWILCLVILAAACAPALAHSTKGRMKVPLRKATLTIDDVAYFMESHVNRGLYDDGTNDTKNRFIVEEFIELTHGGNDAVVRFRVLDKKSNTTFEDKLSIERHDSGVWQYHPDIGGPSLEVYTFVPRSAYLWRKQGPILLLLAVVGGCVWLGARLRRLWRKRHDAPQPDGDGADIG